MASRGERTPLLPAYEHPTSLYQSKHRRPLPPIDNSINRALYQPDSGSDSDELTPTLLPVVRSHSDVQSLKHSINQSDPYLYDMNYARTPSPDHSTDSSPGEASLFNSPFASINQSLHQSINPLVFIRVALVTSVTLGLVARRCLIVQIDEKYGLYCLFCVVGLIISLAHCLIDQTTKRSLNLCSSLAKLPWLKLASISLMDCLIGCSSFICIAAVPAYVSIVLPVIVMSLLSINQLNYQISNRSINQRVFYIGLALVICSLFLLLGDCFNQSQSQSNQAIWAGVAGLAMSSALTLASNASKQHVLYDNLIDSHVLSVALSLMTLLCAMCLSPIALNAEQYVNQSVHLQVNPTFIPPLFNITGNATISSTGMFSSTGSNNATDSTYELPASQSFPVTSLVSMSFVEPYAFNLTHGQSSFPNFGSVWLHLCELLLRQPWLLLIMVFWVFADQATKRLSLLIHESVDDPTKQSSKLTSLGVIVACVSLLIVPVWLTHSVTPTWIILLVANLASVGVVLLHLNHKDPPNEVDIWESVWSPVQQAIDEEERAYQSAQALNHSFHQPINRAYQPPSPKRQTAQPPPRPRVF